MSSVGTTVINVLNVLGLRTPLRRVLLRLGLFPWKPLVPEQEFTQASREAIARLRTVVPREEMGAYVEFGVSRGTSMACMYRALADEGLGDTRMIGFDSFAGLPREAADEGWSPGDFRSTLRRTRRFLVDRGVDLRRVTLVPGWFSETLTPATRARLSLDRASIIMIDCDIHSASRAALEFCVPLVGDHALIIFDDWGPFDGPDGEVISAAQGQSEAFDEFLLRRPDLTAVLLTPYRSQSRIFLLCRDSTRRRATSGAGPEKVGSRSSGSPATRGPEIPPPASDRRGPEAGTARARRGRSSHDRRSTLLLKRPVGGTSPELA